MYYEVAKRGVKNGLYVSLVLAKAIVPVYLIIKVMEKVGVMDLLARFASPLMNLLGLPGEASLLLVLGNCLNIYAVLGGIQAMDLTLKQINIIALMLLISHSLFVEHAVLKKLKINALSLTLFRLFFSIVAGIGLNIIWLGGR